MTPRDRDKKLESELNKVSAFLYSFGLVFIEFLLLDLLISDINIGEYKMDFTIGLILTFIIIGLITMMVMAKDLLPSLKEAIMDSKTNIVFTIIGLVSTIFLLNYFLNTVVFSLGILPILGIAIGSFILGRLIELKTRKVHIAKK